MAAVFLAVIIYFGFSAASYFTDPYTMMRSVNAAEAASRPPAPE